jgi:4-hydroxythreonine-4-phosphate dehydrogenase
LVFQRIKFNYKNHPSFFSPLWYDFHFLLFCGGIEMRKNRPIVGITMGDPVGVGPEIVLRLLSSPDIYRICRPIVFGDPVALGKAAKVLRVENTFRIIETPEEGGRHAGTIDLVSDFARELSDINWGHPTAQSGRAMVSYVLQAAESALKGQLEAVVTCPINKHAMNLAGFSYNGHTELLAEKSGCSDYAMMLAGPKLRVVLVTIHQPLREVPDAISTHNIFQTIRITHHSLMDRFGCRRPKIAVAGLNPHAGEECLFGREDADIIHPAVEEAKKAGWHVQGPYPADTIFYRAMMGEFDAVVSMYHDQGLIAFKMIHFSDGVNTTLGLPMIRTSVDHGTAYDIAGTGRADAGSLHAAVEMAVFQAMHRRRRRPETR